MVTSLDAGSMRFEMLRSPSTTQTASRRDGNVAWLTAHSRNVATSLFVAGLQTLERARFDLHRSGPSPTARRLG